jgi:N-acetylmuramoyl-L-alanine amidase
MKKKPIVTIQKFSANSKASTFREFVLSPLLKIERFLTTQLFRPKLLITTCLITALNVGQADATTLPTVENKTNKITFRINRHPPTKEIFSLIKPERLVIDQQASASSLIYLKQWKAKYKKTPGVKEIRVGLEGNHENRLVIEVAPDWDSNFHEYQNFVEFSLTHAENKYANSLHNVPKPIPLQPIPANTKKIGSRKRLTIIIDPGHGGKDPGATGQTGTREKYVVLDISKKLTALLNQSPRYRAILTRQSDRYISLRDRLAIARHYYADLFISIHADAYRNTEARGSSVYALSQRGATSEAARWLAKNENASELMGGIELDNKSKLLQSVLINLSQTASVRDSIQAGSYILSSLNKTNKLHHKQVEQAAFVVLKSPDIPSLLIETGFLSNKKEEKLLASDKQQTKIAWSIYQGIDNYFSVYQHPEHY